MKMKNCYSFLLLRASDLISLTLIFFFFSERFNFTSTG